MLFHSLFMENSYQNISDRDIINISELCCDSRKAVKNCAFFATSDDCYIDGAMIEEALKNGAGLLILERARSRDNWLLLIHKMNTVYHAVILLVEDIRLQMAKSAAIFYENPAEHMTFIGITGTKGKTTTAGMLYEILTEAGIKCGLIGTNGVSYASVHENLVNTTPDSIQLYKILQDMNKNQVDVVIMEVSSQALKHKRVYGLHFKYAVYTNIGNDHISAREHATMEEYVHCKSLLFKQCDIAWLNGEDIYVNQMTMDTKAKCHLYGLNAKQGIELWVLDMESGMDKGRPVTFFTTTGIEQEYYELAIPGIYNVMNALPVIAIARDMGIAPVWIRSVLKKIRIKGRMELVTLNNHASVIIDYAHNAMSLKMLLLSLREYRPNRIICVFGCGGNRACSRRYEMGETSGLYADFSILTSDNPRDEDPEKILDQIQTGILRTRGTYVRITDRKEAVCYAIYCSLPGDMIVLAGKGHEEYQEIKGVRYPMSERGLIEECNELNFCKYHC